MPLERATSLKPDWAVAWNGLGFIHYELKQYSQAAEAFLHLVQLSPGKANYWNSPGRLL